MMAETIQKNLSEPDFYKDIPVPFAVFRPVYDASHRKVVNAVYLYVNQAYCQMAGYSREELTYHYFLDIYPEGDVWFAYCHEALVRKETVHSCFYSEETKHWLDFTVGPASIKDAVAFIFNNVDDSVRKTKRQKKTDNIIMRITKILNNDEEFETSINHALEELSRYIHPDRLYVLETDGYTASNTFEWCARGVEPEIQTLQHLDYNDYLRGWEKYMTDSSSVVIENIENLKADDFADYENLKRQGIRCIAAAPFYDSGKLIGYLGADNYKENELINTQAVLNSISYFIGAKIVNHRLMEDLNRMSHMDILTGVHNRNAMIEEINALESKNVATGIIYADVNNLKNINDTKGHEAGDQALCCSADKLAFHFGRGNVYRAGGDEFVVIMPEVGEEDFEARLEKLNTELQESNPYRFSFGACWYPNSNRIEEALRVADREMYEAKRRFYQKEGVDRRRKNY